MRKNVFWMVAVLLGTIAGSVMAAERTADPVMGVYEGFWKAADGTKGRISAQVRTVAGGKHDGFVAFYKSKTLEGVLKLKAAGDTKFEGGAVKSAGGMLAPEFSGSAQIENGKLTGSFKGEFG